MNQKTGSLKYFIIVSILGHILLFFFFPMSLLYWKNAKLPSGYEFSSFYLVDYQDIVDEQPKPEVKPEPPKIIQEPVEQKVVKEEIQVEEPLDELVKAIEEPETKVSEPSQDIDEEVIPEAEEKVESVAPSNNPLPTLDDEALVFVEVKEPQIISSDLSDEFINLPALDIPSDESILSSLQDETSEPKEAAVEEIIEETSSPEPISKDPELPTDPKLMIVKQITPVLPKNAANEGKTGKTELYIRVQKNGSVDDIVSIISSGDSRIDDIAKRTVLQGWQFQDFHKAYTIHLEIDFTLQQVFLKFINIFFTEDGA